MLFILITASRPVNKNVNTGLLQEQNHVKKN